VTKGYSGPSHVLDWAAAVRPVRVHVAVAAQCTAERQRVVRNRRGLRFETLQVCGCRPRQRLLDDPRGDRPDLRHPAGCRACSAPRAPRREARERSRPRCERHVRGRKVRVRVRGCAQCAPGLRWRRAGLSGSLGGLYRCVYRQAPVTGTATPSTAADRCDLTRFPRGPDDDRSSTLIDAGRPDEGEMPDRGVGCDDQPRHDAGSRPAAGAANRVLERVAECT
jgi:hypothetical protein